jgi:purine nucleoside permease
VQWIVTDRFREIQAVMGCFERSPTALCIQSKIQSVFTSLKTAKTESITSLFAMQKKDLTRKLVIVFYIIFSIYPLTFLNVNGRVI